MYVSCHIFKQRSPSPQHAHLTESLSLPHLHLFQEWSRLTVSASFFLRLTLILFIIPQKGFMPESPVISVMTSSGYFFCCLMWFSAFLGLSDPHPFLFQTLFSLTNIASHHSSYFSFWSHMSTLQVLLLLPISFMSVSLRIVQSPFSLSFCACNLLFPSNSLA